MRKEKIIYWVTTSLAMAMTVTPAFFYFTSPFLIEANRKLGFPDYFRIELGVGKILGAFIILVPVIPRMLKEWAYVAFGIGLVSACIAYGTVDGIGKGLAPAVPLAFLTVSYYYFHKKLQNA